MTHQRLHTDSEVCMYALTVSTIEPKNIKEAMADHSWIESMQDELNQFERLQVWELVPRPEGKNIIALKWLWKNKCDAENIVVRNKTHEFVSMSTPMATERLDDDLQGTPTDQTTYRRMIGELMYLTASRPVIAFATFSFKHAMVSKDSGFELIAYSDAGTNAGCKDVLIIMAQQQHAADVHPDELCPPNKRYDFMDANKKVDLDHVQSYSSGPWIYMAQFWHTLKEDGSKYRLRFMLDKKELTLTLDDFRKSFIFHNATATIIFISAPHLFLKMVPFTSKYWDLTLELKTLSNFKTTGLLQPWQTSPIPDKGSCRGQVLQDDQLMIRLCISLKGLLSINSHEEQDAKKLWHGCMSHLAYEEIVKMEPEVIRKVREYVNEEDEGNNDEVYGIVEKGEWEDCEVVSKFLKQVRNQVPVYVAEGLILERQKVKEETERLIAKAILQERGNIQAQIENAIANNFAVLQESGRIYDDALCGENSAKQQKTLEYEAYVSGESSSGQVFQEEQAPSTSGNQEQNDDFDFWTDSYVLDDDEIPSKQVSQEIMEEVLLTIDEAKLRNMADEMLRRRCTSGDEHQYHIDQMKNFLKSDIIWESRKEILVSSHP
ncbi:hypothetical protein Tco_0059870 [Tanacetum coccineum]